MLSFGVGGQSCSNWPVSTVRVPASTKTVRFVGCYVERILGLWESIQSYGSWTLMALSCQVTEPISADSVHVYSKHTYIALNSPVI